jgi:secondary thiamine-phosphate synthase enzyme
VHCGSGNNVGPALFPEAKTHEETMTTFSGTIHVATDGFADIRDLTAQVTDILRRSGVRQGIVTVFVPGSTAGITTIENEPGALDDLRRAFERVAPESAPYAHNERWGDGNGFAHVRAALLGPGLSVPVAGGEPALGTWQQIVLVDFDNRPRRREVVVQVLGETV